MQKLRMQTKDYTEENARKLMELFPNIVTETIDSQGNVVRAIDKDKLEQEINATVVACSQQRYEFTWPDKKQAQIAARTPITKTLRPCREESVNFDATENLYIEGDNLEVLKLLQETYLGKIKMIYIDPPYNTGHDFVYSDNFAQGVDEYKANSGLYDEEGNYIATDANLDSNGRFHTDWLNMMYPRLRLAKNLLTEDGVIFISIDDNEVRNLKILCDEIFGEQNFIASVCLVNNIAGRSDSKHIATAHEYIVVYSRSANFVSRGLPLSVEQIKEYKFEDGNGKYRLQGLRKRGTGARRIDRPNMYFPIYFDEQKNKVSVRKVTGYEIEIFPYLSDGTEGRWRWGKDTVEKNLDMLEVKMVSGRNEFDVYEKVYLTEDSETRMKSFLLNPLYTTDSATTGYRQIMEAKSFDNPKSVSLIEDLQRVGNTKGAIILDFFSGSATTAHAVMQLNAEDGGKRKFIMVQLPEKCDEKSEAAKAGYKNICEIGKERIRRAGKKIVEGTPQSAAPTAPLTGGQGQGELDLRPLEGEEGHEVAKGLDIGFRVLKVDSSNMEDVYYTPDKVQQGQVENFAQNVKSDRTSEDLLFQVMLDLGINLSSKIERCVIRGKEVFNVREGMLMACFDDGLDDDLIMEIAKKKPTHFVTRDSSIASDSVLTNFEQIFKKFSPGTMRKVL